MAAIMSIGTLLKDSSWTGAFLVFVCCQRRHTAFKWGLYSLLYRSKWKYSFPSKYGRLEQETWVWGSTLSVLDFDLTHKIDYIFLHSYIPKSGISLIPPSSPGINSIFFANNNVNYARLPQFHRKDLVLIEEMHPQMAAEYLNKKCRAQIMLWISCSDNSTCAF